jgi:hypothetical protein
MTAFPRDAGFELVRKRAADHDEWDSFHTFEILRWTGSEFTCPVLSAIAPDVHPREYPGLMRAMVLEHVGAHPDQIPDAVVLSSEGWGVPVPSVHASEEEKQQYEYDRWNRQFWTREDRIEMLTVIMADLYGRMWAASKRREAPDDIDAKFWRPGRIPSEGRFFRGVADAIAAARQYADLVN